MNAASVGLILASVFKMTVDVYKISPFPTSSLCIALFAFTAVDSLNVGACFVWGRRGGTRQGATGSCCCRSCCRLRAAGRAHDAELIGCRAGPNPPLPCYPLPATPQIFEPFVVAGGILLGLIAWGAKTY